MYGGIEDSNSGNKIAPTADVYSMKLHLSKFSFAYSLLFRLRRLLKDAFSI